MALAFVSVIDARVNYMRPLGYLTAATRPWEGYGTSEHPRELRSVQEAWSAVCKCSYSECADVAGV